MVRPSITTDFRFHINTGRLIVHRVKDPIFFVNLLTHLHEDLKLFEVRLTAYHETETHRGVQLGVVDPFGCALVVGHVAATDLVIRGCVQRVVWI